MDDDARGEATLQASLERLVIGGGLQGEDIEPTLDPAHELQRLVRVSRTEPDGRVLLSTADLAHVDLSSRERWEGVLLNEAEAYDVLDQLGFEEAAAKTVAHIITQVRNAKKQGGNGE